MNRREFVAFGTSIGLLTAGGVVAVRGLPSLGTDTGDAPTETDDDGSITVDTFDARGSEAGTVEVPATGTPTVVSFFVTGCGSCQAQMSRLARANDRLGDEARFLSVTYQRVGETLDEGALRDWWAHFDGNWTVGHDPTSTLARRYGVVGYPVTIVVDTDGTLEWEYLGVASANAIVDAVEPVLEQEEINDRTDQSGDEPDS